MLDWCFVVVGCVVGHQSYAEDHQQKGSVRKKISILRCGTECMGRKVLWSASQLPARGPVPKFVMYVAFADIYLQKLTRVLLLAPLIARVFSHLHFVCLDTSATINGDPKKFSHIVW